MATVPPPTFNRAEADRRVRHPLHAVRGTIRRYVTLEGLAVGVLYLAVCFWVGLALDYGAFALFGFDWIKTIDRSAGDLTASFWLRLLILAGVVAGLIAVIAFKVVRRFFREFRDSALALVLERRFPRELGDRLITAVEMADPRLAEKYGFSQEMLDQTIRAAADRVSQLPVHEVFAWGRLYWRLAWAAVASVGVYLLVGVSSCIVGAAAGHSASPVGFFHNFNDVAGTWIQRNILLQDRRYWIGNEYLEYVRFPDTEGHPGEMRVARDEYRPDIWFRAVKWARVERSPEAPEGLRALRWSELPGLLGTSMPQVALPKEWTGWVIDMDDLDPSVPAGVLSPDWKWHNKTSGAIRPDLLKKRQGLKQVAADLVKESVSLGQALTQERAALAKAEIPLAALEEQYKQRLHDLSKTQAAQNKQGKAKDAKLAERLAQQQQEVANLFVQLEQMRNDVARRRYEVGQREQYLAGLGKSHAFTARLATGLEAVERMLDWHTWTVDKIELQLRKAPGVSQSLRESHPQAHAGFEKALELLADLADAPGMRGTVRMLNVPERVVVTRVGKLSKNTSPRNKEENNKYSFSLNDVKESVELTVSGDEYTTQPRRITLVPPPFVARLSIDKEEPAYIHYRLLGDEAVLLKGKRQLFRGVTLSTTGAKTVIPVPLGTTLTVTGVADRDLQDGVAVVAPPRREEAGSFTPPVDVRLLADRRTFEATFKRVTRVLEFDFEFRDVDSVKGRRHIVIKPSDDKAPNLVGINLAVILRPDYDVEGSKGASKTGERLLITVNALLPFRGLITDDRGLSRIEWPWEVVQVEFQKLGDSLDTTPQPAPLPPEMQDDKLRHQFALLVTGTCQYTPSAAAPQFSTPQLLGVGYLAALEALRVAPRKHPTEKGTIDMESFVARAEQRVFDDVTVEEMERLLQIQPRNRPLALELIDLKGDAEQKAFLEGLKDQKEALLTDVLHFLKLTPAERGALLSLVKDHPGEAVRRILAATSADKDEQERIKTLLRKQPEKALIKDHALDQDLGFDVRKYLPRLKAGSDETQQRHYELRVFVSATDNNIENKTGPVTAPRKGPFVFLVVSENELLAEIVKQERKLYHLLKEGVDGMDTRKTTLELEIAKFSLPRLDLTFTAVRADQARKSVREAGDIARGVLEKYNIILHEMQVNRIEGDKIKKVKERIIDPLASMTNKSDGDFGIVERTVSGAWRGLEEDVARLKKADAAKNVDAALLKDLEERRETHRVELERSGKQMGALIGQLRSVLEAMQDIEGDTKLIELLVLIEAARRENHRLIQDERERVLRSILDFGDEPKGKKK